MKGKKPMNYVINEGENRSLFHVKETKTNQTIKSFKHFSDARRFMVHLNSGGGFDGNTPTFFLKNIGKIDSFV